MYPPESLTYTFKKLFEKTNTMAADAQRTRRYSDVDENNNAEQRIARLENQVEGLRKAVRELADALQEELTTVDGRLAAVDARTEDVYKVQASQSRAIKKQEERLRKGLTVITDALAVLTLPSSSAAAASVELQSREGI